METPSTTDEAGRVDTRDTLKPGQWDRAGGGEIDEDMDYSSVGNDGSNATEHTSAGT